MTNFTFSCQIFANKFDTFISQSISWNSRFLDLCTLYIVYTYIYTSHPHPLSQTLCGNIYTPIIVHDDGSKLLRHIIYNYIILQWKLGHTLRVSFIYCTYVYMYIHPWGPVIGKLGVSISLSTSQRVTADLTGLQFSIIYISNTHTQTNIQTYIIFIFLVCMGQNAMNLGKRIYIWL